MNHGRRWAVGELVTRPIDAVAELQITAGDESLVERTHVIDEFAADGQTGGRRVAMILQKILDWKAGCLVVLADECRVLAGIEFDIRGDVVSLVETVDERGQPAIGNALIGIQKDNDLAGRVFDAGVAGRIRRLNLAFKHEPDVVVVGGVVGGNVGGSVRRVVVDENDLRLGVGVSEQGVDGHT